MLTEAKQANELKNPASKKIITLSPGTAEGQLAGGCLSIVVSTLGTGYEIDTKDKILFFEDIDEKPHRIDRYLTHLIQAGKLHQAKGIIFGTFSKCEYLSSENYFKFGVTFLDLIKERIFASWNSRNLWPPVRPRHQQTHHSLRRIRHPGCNKLPRHCQNRAWCENKPLSS